MDGASGWRDLIRSRANAPLAEHLIRLVERLHSDYGVIPRPPKGNRRDYVSLMPPDGSSARMGAITIGSGRFYGCFKAARRDQLIGVVPLAEPAEGSYLARHIRSDSDEGRDCCTIW